jgi:hypothetical protein
MGSWLVKQSQSVENDIDILDGTSSTIDGSRIRERKRRVGKYETDF